MTEEKFIRKANTRYQSDVIVDLIKAFDFPAIPLNPGASYRGLHDSLVNYGEDDPPMILCNHEKLAVQIAHGYAKATGKPMPAIVHNVVGLLHAPLAVYYAYIDRCPVFLIGATGPMNEQLRRPFIDWIHTAFAQGSAIRDYTKWDYQPGSIHGVSDSFARAYSIMMTEPQGPIYMVYDAGIQEAELKEEIEIPPSSAVKVPSRLWADPDLIDKAADMLLKADYPILLTEYAARAPLGFDDTVELAETLGCGVFDINKRLGFPNKHSLNLSMHKDAFEGTDLVCALDVIDWTRGSHKPNWETRQVEAITSKHCKWIDIGFADIEISKWATDYNKHHNWDLRILADTANAIPALTEACTKKIKNDEELKSKVKERKKIVNDKHAVQWNAWQNDIKKFWSQDPIHESRLAAEIWEVIKDEDWVLSAGTLKDWVRKVWNFDKPYRHPGRELGTATQFGISLGVALAYKNTEKIVVNLQPDGDLMFDLGGLWIAAKYEIPMLCLMYNNRAYYNDWAHQISVANKRGTDPNRAYIGMDLEGPAPDFAHIARGMDWWAEGPIHDPKDIQPAVKRALKEVKKGKPALVDIITWRRGETA